MNKILKGISNRAHRHLLSAQKWGIAKGLVRHQTDKKLKPVLVNSIPKSGTHLLSSIVHCIPGLKYYGAFIASTPSFSLQQVSNERIYAKLSTTLSNEIVHGHVFYNEEIAQSLIELGLRHFLIVRDPRDILCSEVDYLTSMAPWHAMHRYYKRLDNSEARLRFGIKGNEEIDTHTAYDRIEIRIGEYLDWIDDSNTFLVRYEDLVGKNKGETIGRIVTELLGSGCSSAEIETIEREIENHTDPKRSHTFNKGSVGRWKSMLSDENKTLFKEYSGDILQRLGYEEDDCW